MPFHFIANLRRFPVTAVVVVMLGVFTLAAQDTPPKNLAPEDDAQQVQTAPIIVDGVSLFTIRGVSAYPAGKRAHNIADRIVALAKDKSFTNQKLHLVEGPYGTQIFGGDLLVLTVYDDDARLEGSQRSVLAGAYMARVGEAIDSYRNDRQLGFLTRHAVYAFAALIALSLAALIGLRGVRRVRTWLELRYKGKVRGLEIQELELLHARQVWNFILRALAFVGGLTLFIAAYTTVYYVLSEFPWTRGFSNNLFMLLVNPLYTIGGSTIKAIPDLIFLAVLVIVTYYILKLIQIIFAAIENGKVNFSGFETEWARPTYRLIRGVVVICGLVVAFPYIPGSDTQAFKGISILIGVIFSFGSTSLVGNLIGGFSLTYRRVFRKGDRVKIGDFTGYVLESKTMVTYLRTVKNEVIAVPNSEIISTNVTNYSSLARDRGLILHTTVGIGYETPWRQVEAMLTEAAARTPGLLSEPKPFVHQKELGTFAIVYEINAYCDSADGLEQRYTELQRNILDVFNEHSVQIMTPAYERDPEQAKLVPKSKWYAAPAQKDGREVKAAAADER
jgi:small-conductance mechanosensitive channel